MRKIDKKITIKDIADATNLSINTVSKVLKKKPYYSLDVEKRVTEAARKLGYVGDHLASALRSGKSDTVGIIYDDFMNPFYTVMSNIIARRLKSEGYDTLIFSNYGKGGFLDFEVLSQLLSRKVDGIISFLEPENAIVDSIKNSDTYFFIFGRDGRKYGFDSICFDDYEGGRLAARHLVELGHRNVAYIGVNKKLIVDNTRFEGFKYELKQSGITFNENNAVYLRDFNNFASLFKYYMENIDAKAAFCFNDIFSFQFIERLNKEGLTLPKDFALVGFDNIQDSLHLPATLTTIGPNLAQLSDISAEMILSKLKQEEKHYEEVRHEILKVHLYRGNST